MICIDSDVFLIDLRYPRDRRARTTRAFLNTISGEGNGATTVINLLEITGVLSFNLNAQQLLDFYVHFPRRYNVRVLPSYDPRARVADIPVADVLRVMQRKAAFGDAVVAAVVNRLRPGLEAFVTWNEVHFRELVSVSIFTPATFPMRRRER